MKNQKKLKKEKKEKAIIYPCLIRLNHTLRDDIFAKKLKRIRMLAKKSNMRIAKIEYDKTIHNIIDTCGHLKRKNYRPGFTEITMNIPQAVIFLEKI